MAVQHRVNELLRRMSGYELQRAGTTAAQAATARRGPPRSFGSRKLTEPLPPPGIAAGDARASNFFDDYPTFFETSQTTPQRIRLNLRYEAIFGQNRDLFDGARVLDIASHDGRWSFAALHTGASEVIGIEGRPDLVDNANTTFEQYGVDRDRYRFVAGDIFEVLDREAPQVDVVLCLGFLYHTLRYNELFALIANCRPKAVIIDSRIIVGDDSLVFIRTEPWATERNAINDAYTRGDRVLTGRPSKTAIETMAGAYGFDVERYADWAALLRDNPVDDSINVYRKGQRVTMRCVARRSPNQ